MKTDTILGGLEPEVMERIVSRRDAVLRTGRMAGLLAIASLPATVGVLARSAFAQGGLPQGVVDVLNFALALEYLEDEFYRTGLASDGAIAAEHRTVFEQIGKHETAHVALLEQALGASATPKPTFDFTAGGAFADVFTNPATFLALSQGFEDTGVRAYKGQATALMSQAPLLQTALQIHSVEARHASEVRRIRGFKGWITGSTVDVAALQAVYAGEEVTTQASVDLTQFGSGDAASEAFDEPLTMEQVNAIAGLFIVPAA